MRKLQIEDAEVMRIALQQEIARSEESRYDHRLHGLLLVTAGPSCRQVAKLLGENGTTVQRWVRRFGQGGLELAAPQFLGRLSTIVCSEESGGVSDKRRVYSRS